MEEGNKNVLIICPSMWPEISSWGETQRMFYLANYLAQNGFHVCTISPGHRTASSHDTFNVPGEVNDSGAFNTPGTKNDHCERPQFYTSFFLGLSKTNTNAVPLCHSTGTGCRSESGFDRHRPPVRKWIRRAVSCILEPFVSWTFHEPDCYEGLRKLLWVVRYRRDIFRIIQAEQIREVIISVPPFSLLWLGARIRRKFPTLRIIYDYRDPWYLWNCRKTPAFFREKKWLSYADDIVGTSSAFCEDMKKIFHLPGNKVHPIYNGYSEADWRAYEQGDKYLPPAAPHLNLRITYTGSLTLINKKKNYRNLNSLISYIKDLPGVELYLVGIHDEKAGTTEGNIHYIGHVEQELSFQYMQESDILLSIHDSGDCSGNYIISSKFYDYIRSGKIMWHIGAPHDLMANIIQTYHLGVTCENKEDALKKTLQGLLVSWRDGSFLHLRNGGPQDISVLSREKQNEIYRKMLAGN